MKKNRIRQIGAAKIIRWSYVKFDPERPEDKRVTRWIAHEVIHGRFALWWALDPTAKKQTGYRFRPYRESPAYWFFRIQIGRFCAQLWLWRYLLWTYEDDLELRRDCAALRAKWRLLEEGI